MNDLRPIHKRQGAFLPHWTREHATYFTTFRLADSLPPRAIEKLQSETRLLEHKLNLGAMPMTPEELARLSKLKSKTYHELLDNGYGSCTLRQDQPASIVTDALHYFAEERYRLWAWCVMPNHVHAVVQPMGDHELSSILHSWKSFTANKINRLLNRNGAFWQKESYDHLVRDEQDFQHAVRYTLENPAKAGLRNWKWVGQFGQVS